MRIELLPMAVLKGVADEPILSYPFAKLYYLQWNRPHVIATREQGLLIKRLMPGTTANSLSAVSENTQYPPFDIPKEEITGIALVIGHVNLE